MARPPKKKAPAQTPWAAPPALEWIAAGLGLVLSCGTIGFVLWEATQPVTPPSITLQAAGVERTAGGWLVEVEARNASLSTAAAVEVEGVLSRDGADVETSSMTLDYLPGQGKRTGGLLFENDPRTNELKLRTKGYIEP